MIVSTEDRQIEREVLSRAEGVSRYNKKQDRLDVLDSSPGKSLVFVRDEDTPNVIEILADALEEMVARVEAGKAGAGRPALITQYLQQLDVHVVSYLTVRITLQAALKQDRFTSAAMRLAKAINDQYRFDELMLAEPDLGFTSMKKAEKWTSAFHRTSIMRKASDVAGVRGLSWSKGDMSKLGGALINKFVDVWKLKDHNGNVRPRIFVEPRTTTGKQEANHLLCDGSMTQWIEDAHLTKAITEPKYLPMVVPPKPWTTIHDGGYLTPTPGQCFIRGMKREFQDDVMSLNMPEVFAATNAAQATAWKINDRIRLLMQECWDTGGQLGGMPPADDLPLPPRPASLPRELRTADMTDEQVGILKAFRVETAKAYSVNAQIQGKRTSLLAQLGMAKDLAEEERFWFPHSVDFRGRLYSIVPELNPQADDFGKALLQFAEGRPLGEYGPFWLAVHIANLFGVDKVSFEDRVRWVEENTNAILDSAMAPLDGGRFWCEADKPWCALAACMEWLGFQRDGADYISHIPVAMDGSCSGLQHFSAMLLDAEGAQAVNLTDNETPADIYTQVQERVEELLLETHDNLSFAWRGKVTRKIVKRPCMTFAYSVTARGMRDQIMDELRKATGDAGYLPGFDNFEAANYLAPIVQQAIRDTVKRAAEAMDWLKEVVRLLVKNKRPVTWSTPLGFVVQQRYQRSTSKRFNVWFQGRRLRMNLRVDGLEADGRKQASAVAPNFVHSLDACHLQMVLNRMVDSDITTSFSVIHDSFGVHACDVDELHYAIRDEFVKLYSVSQLEKFRNWVLSALPSKLHSEVPEVPGNGSFNIQEVRRADFFFA